MSIFTLEPYLNAAAQAAPGEKTKLFVETPEDTDFPRLLRQAGCVDKGDFLPRWSHGNFNYPCGNYVAKRIPLGYKFNTGQVLDHFGCKLFLPAATTRELLAYVAQHERAVKPFLRNGNRLVAIGRDDFTSIERTASVIYVDQRKRVVSHVPLPGTTWTWSDLFLFRSVDWFT